MKKILFSTLITILFVFSATFVLGFTYDMAVSPAGLDGALFFAVVATTIGTVFIVLWGVPMHLFLTYMRLRSVFWYMSIGFVPAFLINFVFNLFSNGELGASLTLMLTIGSIGSAAALVFRYFTFAKQK